jgi:hypothetical protein
MFPGVAQKFLQGKMTHRQPGVEQQGLECRAQLIQERAFKNNTTKSPGRPSEDMEVTMKRQAEVDVPVAPSSTLQGN